MLPYVERAGQAVCGAHEAQTIGQAGRKQAEVAALELKHALPSGGVSSPQIRDLLSHKALRDVCILQSRPSSTPSSASPFAQAAAQGENQEGQPKAPKKPGLLGRFCACGQKPAAQELEEPKGQPLESRSGSTSTHGVRVRQLSIIISPEQPSMVTQ